MSETQTIDPAAVSDAYITTPAEHIPACPEPAEKELVWKGPEGQEFSYQARAAHIAVQSDSGKLMTRMFSLSYARTDAKAQEELRPVTFLYNGGPGCASIPVNFGGMGPKRVETPEITGAGDLHLPPLARAVDNPHTLLKYSDLVFLDAPGTGWSSVAADADTSKMFGIDGDADMFARAICTWIDEHQAWHRPLFLFGESYGTTRNAALMNLLAERGISLSGVVMMSSIFDFAQVLPGSDLYYLGMFPTYAATAKHFGLVGEGVDDASWFEQASTFAETILAPALLQGPGKLEAQKPGRALEIAQGMADFIGLDAQFILDHEFHIDLLCFRRELLKDQKRLLGRFDLRVSSKAPGAIQGDDTHSTYEDASSDAFNGAWTRSFHHFCCQELGFKATSPYVPMNYFNVGTKWNWKHEAAGVGGATASPNTSYDIACALKRNPHTKMMFVAGRFDAATPAWNTVHDLQTLDYKLCQDIYYYNCGHMAYADTTCLEAMDKDFEAFYQRACQA